MATVVKTYTVTLSGNEMSELVGLLGMSVDNFVAAGVSPDGQEILVDLLGVLSDEEDG